MLDLTCRLAAEADVPAIETLMDRAIAALQRAYLSPAESPRAG